MKYTSFKANDGVLRTLSVNDIVGAMRKYDRQFRRDEEDSGRLYAVRHAGTLYPPKRLLSLSLELPVTAFCGGEGKGAANNVFRELGFEVISLAASRIPISAHDPKKINAAIPPIRKLIDELFSLSWTNLHANYGKLRDAQYPGVYLIAYSKMNLEGRKVHPSEVFYVGMSHAGLIRRLEQFIAGLEDGSHHSGSKRFFRDHAGEVPYSLLKRRKSFYVAALAVPCVVNKQQRTPSDLRKMGEVARLEYYALAYIREATRIEPELNLK